MGTGKTWGPVPMFRPLQVVDSWFRNRLLRQTRTLSAFGLRLQRVAPLAHLREEWDSIYVWIRSHTKTGRVWVTHSPSLARGTLGNDKAAIRTIWSTGISRVACRPWSSVAAVNTNVAGGTTAIAASGTGCTRRSRVPSECAPAALASAAS